MTQILIGRCVGYAVRGSAGSFDGRTARADNAHKPAIAAKPARPCPGIENVAPTNGVPSAMSNVAQLLMKPIAAPGLPSAQRHIRRIRPSYPCLSLGGRRDRDPAACLLLERYAHFVGRKLERLGDVVTDLDRERLAEVAFVAVA